MKTIAGFLILLILGSLFSFYLYRGKNKSSLYFSGSIFLIIGILLSPAFFEQLTYFSGYKFVSPLSNQFILKLYPVICLLLSYIGLAFGLQLNIKDTINFSNESMRLSISSFFINILFTGGLISLFFWYFKPELKPAVNITYSGIIALVVTPSSRDYIRRLLKKAFCKEGKTANIFNAVYFENFLTIIFFGVFTGLLHPGLASHNLTLPEIAIITLLSLLLPVFLFLLEGTGKKNESNMFFLLIGGLVISTGFSVLFKFSPLLVSLITGIIISNFTSVNTDFKKIILNYLRPVNILLLVLIGLLWKPVEIDSVIVITGIIFLRYFLKILSGYFSYKTSRTQNHLSPGIGTTLLSYDILGLAMLTDLLLNYDFSEFGLMINLVIATYIFYNSFSYNKIFNYLIDHYEIKGKNL